MIDFKIMKRKLYFVCVSDASNDVPFERIQWLLESSIGYNRCGVPYISYCQQTAMTKAPIYRHKNRRNEKKLLQQKLILFIAIYI